MFWWLIGGAVLWGAINIHNTLKEEKEDREKEYLEKEKRQKELEDDPEMYDHNVAYWGKDKPKITCRCGMEVAYVDWTEYEVETHTVGYHEHKYGSLKDRRTIFPHFQPGSIIECPYGSHKAESQYLSKP